MVYFTIMDDLQFVRSCVNGDKQAWDEFVEKYSRLVYSYVHKVIGARGNAFAKSHAQDIFQDFFCFLIKDNFKKLSSFQAKNGCSLASWLRHVAVNFTIDYLRRLKPAVSLDEENDDGLSLKDIIASEAPIGPEIVIEKEQLANLKDCVGKLNKREKLLLELHFHRGARLEDLKSILELSRGAIDMQKSRIIEKLRECFKGKGYAFMLET